MPRIPRPEPSVPIQMANQPTMSPDALTGPGRALQGLGRAISGLAGAFEDTGPTDDQRFAAEMSQVKAYNDMSAWYANYENSYTEDKDPTEYDRAGQAGLRSQLDGVDTTGWHPNQVREWELKKERILGGFRVRGIETAGKRTIVRNVGILENNLKGFIEHLDPDSPQFESELKAFDSRIEGLRGASPADRKRIMDAVAEQLTDKLLDGLRPAKEGDPAPDPGPVIERIQKLQKRWEDILSQPPPPGPPQGQGVGPQSSAKPIMDDSQRKRLSGVDDRVVEKLSLLQGEMGRRFKINSGYRSKAHNARVGGASKSQHIHGNAVDLDVSSLSNEERTAMIAKASALGFTGIGVYNNALHLDIGGRRAWGPDYTHKSVPEWARSAVDAHIKGGFASEQIANDVPDYRGKSGPASIRYNNPGAMYPGPSSRKFGAVETKIIGGGHKIAVFPDAVSGAAAQFDLLDRSYTGKTLKSAIAKWSGGNSVSTYLNVIERETGVTPDTVLTKDMVADPRIAIPIAKAMAVQEAGKAYPMNDAQWAQAHQMFAGGGSGTQTASAPPVSERGRTQYADVPKPTQVADMSGRIGGSEISGRIASRVDQPAQDGQRPTNTIPGQQTAQEGKLSPQEWSEKDRSSISATQPGLVPNAQAAGGVIQGEPTGILGHAVEKLKKRLPALLEYKAKWDKNQQDRAIVEGQLKGEIPFNLYDKDDTKRLNEQYDMSKITERIVAGDVAAMAFAVNNAKTLGYVPPKFRDTLLAMTRDMDPEKVGMRIAGYEMASDIALAFPNAFDGENGGALKRESMDYAAMVGTGMGQKEALAWLDEMRTPAWKKKEAENAKFVDAAIKTWDEKEGFDWVAKAVGEELDQDMFSDPVAQSFLIPQMAGEFREAFRRHYIRMPDEASAKKAALDEIKGAYGISRIGEKSMWTPFGNMQGQRLMKYPIENHYPAIAGKPTADGAVPSYDYIEEDVLNSVRSWINDREQSALDRGVKSVAEVGAPDEDKQGDSEITMKDIYLVGDDVTRRLIEKRNPDEPPSYVIVYRDPKTELLQQIPPEQLRWSMPPQLIKALQAKKAIEINEQTRKNAQKLIAPQSDEPAPSAPQEDTKALELINKIPSGPKLDGSLTGEIGKRLAPLFETNQKPKQPKREITR